LEKFELDKRIQLEQVEFLLESYKGSQLPLELRHFCFEIVEKHTRQELDCFNFLSTFRLTHCYSYESAGLWSASGKKAELRSDAARFLLVRSYPHMNLVCFVHYRFTIENQENVLYIYELHIVDGYQGLGIGKKLVQVLETIGVRTKMKKIMLTVFKRNVDAVRFYKEKLGLCGTILISSDTYAILGFLWMHRLQRFLETWNANMKFFLNTWFQYAKIVL